MNKEVYKLIAMISLVMIINNLAHPVTPELVNSLGYGSFLFGVLFATMSFATFVMSFVWGFLSDRYGRKRFMILSPIGYGLAQIGFGFSTNPIIIVLFRLMAGSFSCAIFVCGLAALIDVTERKDRSKMMTLYTASTGFAANVGYLIGGYIGNHDYHIAFIVQSISSLLAAGLIFIVVRETKLEKIVVKRSNPIRDLGKYKGSILPFMLVMTILTSIITVGFNNSFNFYMEDILDFPPFHIGIVMAIIGLIGLFTNIILYPIFKRAFNDFYLLLFSILMLGITLTVATTISQLELKIIFLVPFFAFLALYKPLLQSIISHLGTDNGEVMGLNNTAVAFGNVIGALFVGALFSMNVNMTFYSLALIGFMVFLLLNTKRTKLKDFGKQVIV